ncbi:MAG: hypothetical protein K2X47_15005, partial [Bdellovibrionales bacterium]|nr:hypothetical protein [Bdellovibrionales bacterium]
QLQLRRYGVAFPDWIRGGIGEIIHHIKGKPQKGTTSLSSNATQRRLRFLVRSKVIEPIFTHLPLFQRFLAFALRRISG